MKKIAPIIISAIASFILVFVIPFAVDAFVKDGEYQGGDSNQIAQEIVEFLDSPIEIVKVYDNGEFIGVLQNEQVLNEKLQQIYNEKYKEKFPNSSLILGEDMYTIVELSYIQYENKNAEILSYIESKNSFALETNAIEFSNSQGVFAILYVDDITKYDEALEEYMLYFVDEEDFAILKNNQTVPELSTYGTRDKSVRVYQGVTIKRAYVDPEKIKTTTEEVLEYLRYGDGVEKEYYIVEPYDMVDGVATKVGNGLTAQQLVNINDGILQSVDQILESGTELLVTDFESPLDVEVIREAIVQEEIYITEPLLIEDPLLYQGESEIVQESQPGYQNVLYEETWINGYLVRGEEVSSVVTKQPQQEIIRVGSKEIPSVGTGSFRMPVDNAIVSCAWGCYPGHRGVDFQNAYNRYGDVYAADRGVVKVSSYHSINGYYMVIDHGNGYESYYGHMHTLPYYDVGDVVNKGDIIGQIGMTGVATAPHVHFFLLYNGERRNPCEGYLGC
ncbi:MAG: peptidoglycan DD-metalloendopeptidase family protein [Anaerorhabdus sp.]